MNAVIAGVAIGLAVVGVWEIIATVRAETILRREDKARAMRLQTESLGRRNSGR